MWLNRLILAGLLARAALGESTDDNLINSAANTNPATANKTSTLSTLSVTPTIIFQESAAGQGLHTILATATASSAKPSATTIVEGAFKAVKADAVSYLIPLNPDSNFDSITATCWYPVSGYYGDLSRYLFYVTLGFALLARTHEWLIIGALAASLTYSAGAAVHTCVLVWSGQAFANPDVFAVLGILSLSAALIVPLLNWSSTIKNIGKDREENSVGRTIIVYWGILIFLAFLSLFGAFFYNAVHYKDDTSFLKLTADSSAENITCTPPSGILDLTADQKEGWDSLGITEQFIDTNGCTNPCTGIRTFDGIELFSITRDPKDLIPLTARQYDFFVFGDTLTVRQQFKFNFVLIGAVFGVLSLVWVILQGATVVFFGRRTPSEVRNFIYIKLTRLFSRAERKKKRISTISESAIEAYHPEQHRIPSFFAKSVAIIFYLWSWSASVVSAIIAIFAITGTEIAMHAFTQSDENYQVDQWGSWAATALVLFTAFAYRFQGVTEDLVIRFINGTMTLFYRCCHGRRPRSHRHASTTSVPRETNRELVWDVFASSFARKTTGLWKSFSEGTKSEWNGNMKFLRNGWAAAVDNQGTGHLRRRRNIGAESQGFPEGWQKKHDHWMSVDEFIAAVKEFDAEHRRKHGAGYLWQPKVTEEAPLREKFDRQLLKDLFSRNRQPSVHEHDHLPVTNEVEGKGLPVDEEAAYKPSIVVQAVAMDEHPAFHKSTKSVSPVSPLNTTGEATPNHTTPSPLEEVIQATQKSEAPIRRVSTLPVSRYSTQQKPPTETLQHAATIHSETSWRRRQDDYRPALARNPDSDTSGQVAQQAQAPASETSHFPVPEVRLAPPGAPEGYGQRVSGISQTSELSSSATDKNLPPRPSLSLLSLNLSEDSESAVDSPDSTGRRHPVTPASRSVMSDNSSEPTGKHSQRHFMTPTSTKISSSNGDTGSSHDSKGV